MTTQNNFNAFKTQFKSDTGFDVNKDTMSMYIEYYKARCLDIQHQIIFEILQIIKNPPMKSK